VEFLCLCLWPDKRFVVRAALAQASLMVQVEIQLHLNNPHHEMIPFRYGAHLYPTGELGPVPREVIAQINMVTA
jgi:hypothetical protein